MARFPCKVIKLKLILASVAFIALPLFLATLDVKWPSKESQAVVLSKRHFDVYNQTLEIGRERYDGTEGVSVYINRIVMDAESQRQKLQDAIAFWPHSADHLPDFTKQEMYKDWRYLFNRSPRFYLRFIISLDMSISRGQVPQDGDLPSKFRMDKLRNQLIVDLSGPKTDATRTLATIISTDAAALPTTSLTTNCGIQDTGFLTEYCSQLSEIDDQMLDDSLSTAPTTIASADALLPPMDLEYDDFLLNESYATTINNTATTDSDGRGYGSLQEFHDPFGYIMPESPSTPDLSGTEETN